MPKTDTREQLAVEVMRCRHDPERHARLVYPWGEGELRGKTLRNWQVGVLRGIGEHLQNPETRHQPYRVAIGSGHGIGKSATIAMIAKWAMDTCVDCKVVITANTEGQLRTKTSPEVAKWFRMALTSDWFKVSTTQVVANGAHSKTWRLDFVPWSEHNTEAFAGLHNEGKRIVVIYDEASKIADRVWEVTEGAMTDEGTEILWIAFGNMTRGVGRFRECFRKHRHRWNNKQIDSREVEGTNKDQIQRWIDDYGEDSDFVKVRVRGMPPSMSGKQFLDESDVDDAFGKHLREHEFEFAPVILSCDPAWDGGDEIVIARRQGLAFSILRTLPKNDNDVEVANILARFADENRADAVFIDFGYGTGIYSAGITMGRGNWHLVKFGGKSGRAGCLNKRAEIYAELRDWLKEGGALPKDNQLRDELLAMETKPKLDGTLVMQGKEELRDVLGQSPNRADALALTFAFPVERADVYGDQDEIEEHDPYASYREE